MTDCSLKEIVTFDLKELDQRVTKYNRLHQAHSLRC